MLFPLDGRRFLPHLCVLVALILLISSYVLPESHFKPLNPASRVELGLQCSLLHPSLLWLLQCDGVANAMRFSCPILIQPLHPQPRHKGQERSPEITTHLGIYHLLLVNVDCSGKASVIIVYEDTG